jgi:predicted ATP-dependent Lon-type protease
MAELRYFFSYARKDSDFVLKLAKELRAVGVNLWLDQLDILGGQLWDRAVEEALKTCQGMIAVLSPAESVTSNNVMDEVSYALEARKLVIPVVISPCDIPFRLRRVQHIDCTAGYDTAFSQPLKALHCEVVRP